MALHMCHLRAQTRTGGNPEMTSRLPNPRLWDLDDLIGTREIAAMYNVSKQAVMKWASPGTTFPAPLTTISGVRVYSRVQVVAWKKPPPGPVK